VVGDSLSRREWAPEGNPGPIPVGFAGKIWFQDVLVEVKKTFVGGL